MVRKEKDRSLACDVRREREPDLRSFALFIEQRQLSPRVRSFVSRRRGYDDICEKIARKWNRSCFFLSTKQIIVRVTKPLIKISELSRSRRYQDLNERDKTRSGDKIELLRFEKSPAEQEWCNSGRGREGVAHRRRTCRFSRTYPPYVARDDVGASLTSSASRRDRRRRNAGHVASLAR